MSYPRFTIEVRMLKDSWVEFVPEENSEIPNYSRMCFKEKAITHIKQYNDANEFPKQIVSYIAKSSMTGKVTPIDDYYGLCIDPEGDIWKVGYCDHKCVIGFNYDSCDEWVLTVNPTGPQHPYLCVRLVPNKVSDAALKKAISVVSRSKVKRVIIETILTNKIYDDMNNPRNYGVTKAEAIKRLSTINTLDIDITGIR